MSTDIDDAADTVIGLTNTVGATAVDIQHATQAVRALRRAVLRAADHPARLAAVGCGLIVAAGVLAARGPGGRLQDRRRPPTAPGAALADG